MANSGDESSDAFVLERPDGSVRDKAAGYTGPATAHFANGDMYKGEYLDGQRHGKGVYTYSDGNTFEGSFKQGKKTDIGRMDYVDGGFFNAIAGSSCSTYVNTCFIGTGFDGTGIAQRAQLRKFVCEGYFNDNLRHGEGTRRYANGDVYYGQWLNGKRHGEGVYIFGTTKQKLRGTWANGSMVEGSWIWVDGTRFEGKFQLNKPIGSGTWMFPSGTSLKGVYSQRIMPLDDTPDDDPVPAEQVQLDWTPTAA